MTTPDFLPGSAHIGVPFCWCEQRLLHTMPDGLELWAHQDDADPPIELFLLAQQAGVLESADAQKRWALPFIERRYPMKLQAQQGR